MLCRSKTVTAHDGQHRAVFVVCHVVRCRFRHAACLSVGGHMAVCTLLYVRVTYHAAHCLRTLHVARHVARGTSPTVIHGTSCRAASGCGRTAHSPARMRSTAGESPAPHEPTPRRTVSRARTHRTHAHAHAPAQSHAQSHAHAPAPEWSDGSFSCSTTSVHVPRHSSRCSSSP